MPSFDLVSKTDMMEMKNVLQMAQKEVDKANEEIDKMVENKIKEIKE